MSKWLFIMVLFIIAPLSQTPFAQEKPVIDEQPEWLLSTIKDSLTVESDSTMTIHHQYGDVRVEAGDTDRIQITAVAQHHRDDPREAKVNFLTNKIPGQKDHYEVNVDFAHLEIMEHESWTKRRIDIGILIPADMSFKIETEDVIIEAKKIQANAELNSMRGDIIYDGNGNISAETARGAILARLYDTHDHHKVDLSTLTGKIHCVFLEQANATIIASTRGTISTDYSIDINRPSGSVLKQGKVQIGEKGSMVVVESHNGNIKLEGLIVPEDE